MVIIVALLTEEAKSTAMSRTLGRALYRSCLCRLQVLSSVQELAVESGAAFGKLR